MIKRINFLFVTLFGIGKIKKIPGSFASLVTILFLFFLFHILNISPNIVLFSVIIIFFIALYAVNIFIKDLPYKVLMESWNSLEFIKDMPYECGVDLIGETRVRLSVKYFLIALMFIIFDIEIVFLFPWAVVFQELGLLAFIEAFLFVLILVVGFVYVWAKGI